MTGWQRSARNLLVGGAVVVFVALVLLVRMVLEPARRVARQDGTGEVTPLTDVAAPARRSVTPMPSYEPGPTPGRPAPVALPVRPPIPPGQPGGETAGPSAPAPQWTQPLAVPGPPRPPDPFQEPAIHQDPDRGRLRVGP
jgi:hypothetical protein